MACSLLLVILIFCGLWRVKGKPMAPFTACSLRWAGLWVVGEGGTATASALGCPCWGLHLSPGVWGFWGQASASSTSVAVLLVRGSQPLCSGQLGVVLHQILDGDGVDPLVGVLLVYVSAGIDT